MEIYGVNAGEQSITPAAPTPGTTSPLTQATQPQVTPAPSGEETVTLLFASDDKPEDDIFGGGSSDDSGSSEESSASEPSGSSEESESSNDERGEMPGMMGRQHDSSSGSSDDDCQECIENAAAALEEHLGLHVEPSDDPKKFIEHIATAAKNFKGGKDAAKEDLMGGQPQTPANAGAAPGQAGSGTSEEQRPYLMSTGGEKLFLSAIVSTPLDHIRPEDQATAKVAQKGYRKDTRSHKESLSKKIDQLQANGVSRADCDVLRRKVEGYQLSIDDSGSYRQQLLDTEINTALKMAKHFHGALTFSSLTGAMPERVKVVDQPPGTGIASNDDLLKVAAERGAAVSVGQNGQSNGKH